MKLARFLWQDEVRYVVEGEEIHALSGEFFGDCSPGPRLGGLGDARLLPPVQPRSIVAVGINYPRRVEQHYAAAPQAERYTGPVVFLMPTSSLIGPLDPIVFPALAQEVSAAGELAVVMKRRAKQISASQARDFILGYTCGNDLSSGDLFRADSQQTLRAHGFDTTTVLGPWVETAVSPENLEITLRINGAVASQGNTAGMLYPVEAIVSYLSQFMTLHPGDVIFMGTPMGAAVRVGDAVEVEIEGIGVLSNPVIGA